MNSRREAYEHVKKSTFKNAFTEMFREADIENVKM